MYTVTDQNTRDEASEPELKTSKSGGGGEVVCCVLTRVVLRKKIQKLLSCNLARWLCMNFP